MSEIDYTYAERWNRGGNKYATAIDDSVVDSLTTDADYLEALTDKFAGDAEYAAGVIAAFVADGTYPAALIAALVADGTYPAALGAALAADATFLAAIASELYSSAPVADASFTIGVDGGDNSIDVTIQLLDADAANFAARTMVTVWWCSDADATVPVGPTGTGAIAAEGTAGGKLEDITEFKSAQCVTDETGALTLTFTDDDATGDLTSYLGLMLPNGKYIVSGAMVFNPS